MFLMLYAFKNNYCYAEVTSARTSSLTVESSCFSQCSKHLSKYGVTIRKEALKQSGFLWRHLTQQFKKIAVKKIVWSSKVDTPHRFPMHANRECVWCPDCPFSLLKFFAEYMAATYTMSSPVADDEDEAPAAPVRAILVELLLVFCMFELPFVCIDPFTG